MEVENPILTFIRKHKTQNSHMSKISKIGGITIADFKLYDTGIIMKTAWCWHKNRHADE
jgi:hypothetical protein